MTEFFRVWSTGSLDNHVRILNNMPEPEKSSWSEIYYCKNYVDYADDTFITMKFFITEANKLDICKWLVDNCSDLWSTSYSDLWSTSYSAMPALIEVHFKDKDDAMRYKLVWSN